MKKYLLLVTSPLFVTNLFSEAITVTGKIVDNNNKPLQNVNIYSGTKGTTTDNNGYFELSVNNDDLVNISHIGYKEIVFIADNIPNQITLDSLIISSEKIIVKSGLFPHKLSESTNGINVITQDEIRSGNDEHLQDLMTHIPNLTYASATSRPRYLLIRGIGELSQFASEGPPNYSVGYIIDDVDYSGIGSIGALFDIEQLEVYKGPQTYAFGPNAMAGVVSLQSLNPTPFFNGRAEIGINSDNGKTAGITISNSILKNTAIRITGYMNYTDGFIYNAFRNLTNTNKIDEKYLRIKLIWEPYTWLNMKLTNFLGKSQNGYDAWTPDNNGDTTYTDFQGKDNLKSQSYSLRTNIKPFGYNIYSIFSFSVNDINYSYDGDWGNPDYWIQEPYNWNSNVEGYDWKFIDETTRYRKTIAHDLRVSKSINVATNIISGIYIKQLTENDKRAGWLFGGLATDIYTEFQINTISLYFNSKLNIATKTEINIGTRFNQTDILYDGTGNTVNYTTWEPEPLESLDTSVTIKMIGIYLSIKHRLNNNLNIFSSLSRGYKAGGINQNPYLVDSQRIYDPEYNLNFSAGFSYQKDKIDVLFTAFYMRRFNQQVRLSFQANPNDPLSFDFFTANVSEGFNSGIETSIKYKFNNNLFLNTNIGLLKNHVESYQNPLDPNQKYGNREPAHSPAFSYNITLDYIADNGWYFSVENNGMDAFYFEDQYPPRSAFYSIINASLGYKYSNWDFTVWGKNILNTRYSTRGYYFDLGIGSAGEQSYKMYGRPSHFGVTLDYNF